MKKALFFPIGAIVAIAAAVWVSQRPASAPPMIQVPPVASTATSNVGESPTVPTVPVRIVEQGLSLKNGRKLKLSLPESYSISVIAQGLKKPRFMAKSPDDRLFVGEMESAGDSSKGHVYVFDDFDTQTKTFKKTTAYLSNLRNPNSVVFYTDIQGQSWIYVALTDKLIRYKYANGDLKPSGNPETITTFPDYGRPWSEGGWHATRTVISHNDKIYVSVGSSCNSCEERADEPVRSSIIEMNPDGKELRVYAYGLRNAVGIRFIGSDLYATGNGSDHLGDDKPEDTFYRIKQGTNYGWPYCYQVKGQKFEDNSQEWQHSINCNTVPLAEYGFEPHSAPLGFDAFDGKFLVAIHGSGNVKLNIGYKVLAIDQKDFTASDFLTGFLTKGIVTGRVADVLKNDEKSVYITDDYNGVIYLVEKK